MMQSKWRMRWLNVGQHKQRDGKKDKKNNFIGVHTVQQAMVDFKKKKKFAPVINI